MDFKTPHQVPRLKAMPRTCSNGQLGRRAEQCPDYECYLTMFYICHSEAYLKPVPEVPRIQRRFWKAPAKYKNYGKEQGRLDTFLQRDIKPSQ